MAIDPRVDIGHWHLKVSALDRAIAFYRDVLGFELQHRYGDQAAFLSAGGYHHHIGLNTWESLGGSPPPRGRGAPPPPRAARRASTTSRSVIRIARHSRRRSSTSSTPASRWAARAT